MNVTDHADDVEELLVAVTDVEPLPDRILLREEFVREGLIDDGDLMAAAAIRARERASFAPAARSTS